MSKLIEWVRLAALLLLLEALVIAVAMGTAIRHGYAQQPVCSPWSVLKQALADNFGEVPIGTGLINEQIATYVLASPDGATFSIVTVDTFGNACVAIAGYGLGLGKLPKTPAEEEEL